MGSSTLLQGRERQLALWQNQGDATAARKAACLRRGEMRRACFFFFWLCRFQRRLRTRWLKHAAARPAANEQTLSDETGRKYGRGARLLNPRSLPKRSRHRLLRWGVKDASCLFMNLLVEAAPRVSFFLYFHGPSLFFLSFSVLELQTKCRLDAKTLFNN